MEITLAPELEGYVEELLASGRYHTKDDVMAEALHALRERREMSEAELAELRREVQLGIDDIERGDYDEFDETNIHELAEGVKRRGRELLEASRRKRA
jgi:antitoxin ParD1/3/4